MSKALSVLTALAFAASAGAAAQRPTDPSAPVPTAAATADRATRFNGAWTLAGKAAPLRTSDGKAPPVRAGFARAAGKLDDGTARCLPAGIPRLYLQPRGDFRLVIGQKRAALTFEQNHLYRLIYLDEAHFEAAGPAYLGQSTGRWDGDALVIDTIGFNDQTFLDDAGLRHSDKLHLVERFSIDAAGLLHVRITIQDPDAFTRAWDTDLVFRRRALPLLAEDYCLRRSGLLQAAKR